jgi:heat shock protein HslJ
MKRIVWPAMLLVLLAPHTALPAQEQPLICFGNEPSWRLDLPGTGKASFSTPDAQAVDYVGAAHSLVHRKETVWRGRPADSEGGELVAFLRQGPCSDQMSDISHPYSVNVSLPDGRHLAGCCRLTEAPAASAGLEHGPWRLAELAGGPLPGVRGPGPVTVNFEAGRVHGFSGCNQFMGSYAMEGGRLVLGAIGGTMMACPGPAMALERRFLDAFSGALQVEVSADALILTPTNGRGALRFERAPPPRLEGVRWEVTGYNNGRHAVVGPKVGTRLTLMFQDGQVSGSSGCNRFHGSFKADGKMLTIRNLATTRMACEDAVMAQEQEFLRALQSAESWGIVRGMLDVHRADGERVLMATEVVD